MKSNECLDFVDQVPDPTNNPVVIGIFAVIYINIFLLGLVGNLAIIYLTLRNRNLQTVQNIFILNLAASDVMVCLLSLPFTPVTSIYKVWLFGTPICHLLPMIQAISVFVSTFSLSAIAIDRFILVVRPHCHPLNIRGAGICAGILWTLSASISIPYAYYMKLERYDGICGQYCTEGFPNPSVRQAYTMSVLILQLLIPFAIMLYCYATIFYHLRKRTNKQLKKMDEHAHLLNTTSSFGTRLVDQTNNLAMSESPTTGSLSRSRSTSTNARKRSRVNAQQRRTTGILASMVFIFGLAYLPLNIVSMLMEYDEAFFLTKSGKNYAYLVSMIAHCIAMINNVTNPVLYAWLNPLFKEILLRTLGITNSSKSKLKLGSPRPPPLSRPPSQNTAQPANTTVQGPLECVANEGAF